MCPSGLSPRGFVGLISCHYYRIVKRGRAVSRMMEGSPEAAGTMKDVANGWMDGWKNTERRGGNYYVCGCGLRGGDSRPRVPYSTSPIGKL